MQAKPEMSGQGLRLTPFIMLLALGVLYALPVIFDGRYYLDDLPHAMNGLTLWEQDGRPLASLMSSLLSFSWPSFSAPALYEASPLPQILGVVALAYGASRLAQRLFPQGADVWQCLVVFPVIASPFMLQNLSYKFDALTMGVAVMLALCAATMEAAWAVALLIVLTLGFYQAAFNVFLGACALLWLAEGGNGDRAFIRKLVSGLVGLIAYTLLLNLLGGLVGDYANAHSALVRADAEGFNTVIFNAGFAAYFANLLAQDAPLLALGAVTALLGFALRQWRAENGAAGVLRFILATLLIFAAVAGLLLVLQQPVMRPRTLMGFSILLVLVAYATHEVLKTTPAQLRLALGLATAWFFVQANVYANAARDQTRFEQALSQDIIHALQQVGFKPGGKMAIDGVEPFSPMARNARRKNVMASLLQPNFNDNSEWGFRQLEFDGLEVSAITDATNESLKALCAEPALVTTPQFQIFIHDSTALVGFANGVCFTR